MIQAYHTIIRGLDGSSLLAPQGEDPQMGNQPASSKRTTGWRPPWMESQPVSLQESPTPGWEISLPLKELHQAADSWFWKSVCVARGLRQAEDPTLTNTTTSSTASVRVLRAAASPNKPKPFVNRLIYWWTSSGCHKMGRVLSVGTLLNPPQGVKKSGPWTHLESQHVKTDISHYTKHKG